MNNTNDEQANVLHHGLYTRLLEWPLSLQLSQVLCEASLGVRGILSAWTIVGSRVRRLRSQGCTTNLVGLRRSLASIVMKDIMPYLAASCINPLRSE